MIDPVITQFGNSYEKEVFNEYYRKKELKLDPVTGLALDRPDLIIDNVILRGAIKQFLNKYPWSFWFNDNPAIKWDQIEIQLSKSN